MNDTLRVVRELLAPGVSWQHAYPKLAEIARAVLSDAAVPGQLHTTKWVADLLLPPSSLSGPADIAMQTRLYRALPALAKHYLSDCAEQGPAVRKRFGTMRPWQWHSPTPRPALICCPHCGGYLTRDGATAVPQTGRS